MNLGNVLGSGLRAATHGLGLAWQWVVCTLLNGRRRLFRGRLADYAVIALDHSISERMPDVPWWYAYVPNLRLPLSLEYISDALRHIAEDPDIKGVVFFMKAPGLSLAQAQSLVLIFERFRQWDAQYRQPGAPPKRNLVHLEQVDIPSYIVACGADLITMTPMASWDVLGLRASSVFLKDTLARFGIKFDVVQIAPWKTAADQFSRSEMSPEGRDQVNWLLDSLYEDIVDTVADSRALKPEAVRELIDRSPLTAEEAMSAGLIDKALYKDEIGGYLETTEDPASLKTYASTRSLLLRRIKHHPPKSVGVLNLKGTITGGESRSYPLPVPILGEGTIGSISVEQQIRTARRDDNMAAVIVFVDSGGGSAMASDLICRELALLGLEKPVIVYMGDVAASGGYYIATPATKIVAQSATLTGSIGVIVAKPVTAGAADKIDANRESILRGRNADLYADENTWTDEQRTQVEANVRHYYAAFKQRVADGRGLEFESLDVICNGRVWTGRQALGHGLVDELGDFQHALDLACEASGLPSDGTVRVRNISEPRNRILPEPASPVDALGGDITWSQLRDTAAALLRGDWQHILGQEHYWYLADGLPSIDELKRRS
ncbi:MAG: signal peptide peptidase SppA [Caldilineaceae bacterium]